MTKSRQNRSLTRALLILPLGLTLSGLGGHAASAQTQAPASSCAAALSSLMSEWQAIGFTEPSKPSQMIVVGRDGNTTTAGRFYYMRQLIRGSARDCEAGREQDAMQNINAAHVVLARKNTATQYGN